MDPLEAIEYLKSLAIVGRTIISISQEKFSAAVAAVEKALNLSPAEEEKKSTGGGM